MFQFKTSTINALGVMLACLAYVLHGWRVPPSFPAIGQMPHTEHGRASAASMQYYLNEVTIPRPFEPLDIKVLIRLMPRSQTTSGGLFVADNETAETGPREGLVLAVGPEKLVQKNGWVIPNPYKVGDLVWLSKKKGDQLYWQGAKSLIVDADEILGSFEGNEISATTFQPMGDRIMVQIDKYQEVTTATGVVIAGQDEETRENIGVVRAVGPGKSSQNGKNFPVGISVGDSVFYKQNVGLEARIEDADFLVLEESDVLTKWKDDNTLGDSAAEE
jgi:chaperonin GroES